MFCFLLSLEERWFAALNSLFLEAWALWVWARAGSQRILPEKEENSKYLKLKTGVRKIRCVLFIFCVTFIGFNARLTWVTNILHNLKILGIIGDGFRKYRRLIL